MENDYLCRLVFLPASVPGASAMLKTRMAGSLYFAGSVATYDSNRIVKCGYYDEYNFHGGTNRNDLTGKCSYIVVCQ